MELTDAEISMILDTYMYTDFFEAKDGETVSSVIGRMPELIDVEGRYKKEYSILSQAAQNPQIGELKIKCQSQKMGYNSGTNAIAFVSEDNKSVYIAFRGTADGEWLDNGRGLTQTQTMQQKQALNYFEETVETLGIDEETHLVTTGHSKGGNKVQFITMESSRASLIDRTYSVDGQGHSKASVDRWKQKYTKEEYEERTDKLYAINGQNDFVSVLGTSIIPASHISYVLTPASKTDFAAFHDITRMFAQRQSDENGEERLQFNGTKNRYVLNRGELSDYVSGLSDSLMALPTFFLDGCAASVMQTVEVANKGKIAGVNGELVGYSDIKDFQTAGTGAIIYSLLMKPDGAAFLRTMFHKDEFSRRLTAQSSLEVNYTELFFEASNLKNLAGKINALLLGVQAAGQTLPLYIDDMIFKKLDIDATLLQLKDEAGKLKRLASLCESVAELYEKFDSTKICF